MGKRRWSDNQRCFGPFTYARDTYGRPLGIVLDSGHDESPGCHLRIRGFGHTLLIELPPVIKPWRKKVKAEYWDAATIARIGRDWYYDEHANEYGFQVSEDGFLQVFLGPQTHDSTTTKSWSYFLPWTQWRYIRFSLYDLNGEHFWTEFEAEMRRGPNFHDAQFEAEKRVPKQAFEFDDYDGKRIVATTHIEEREWRFGEGYFKWLSLFRKPQIRRVLSIEFNEEVGPQKGSWKGGTIGTSIDMLPDELHESAFRRYCEQEHRSKYQNFRIRYVGPCPVPPPKVYAASAEECAKVKLVEVK